MRSPEARFGTNRGVLKAVDLSCRSVSFPRNPQRVRRSVSKQEVDPVAAFIERLTPMPQSLERRPARPRPRWPDNVSRPRQSWDQAVAARLNRRKVGPANSAMARYDGLLRSMINPGGGHKEDR